MAEKGLIQEILSEKNMYDAWDQVRKGKGKPGPDEWNVCRWNRNWEENIQRLREQVLNNTYNPARPKRIQIQKKNGGYREICLFNVGDKVLQRAVLNIVNNIVDPKFLECSHAYRPHRSCATAIQQVLNYRDSGYRVIFEADIESCFENIDQEILMNRIKKWLSDWTVLRLIQLWLICGRKYKKQAIGIPQGMIMSPLLCNIYLHTFDLKMISGGWRLIRYADDFIVQCEYEEEAQYAWHHSQSILQKLMLNFSMEKTGICDFNRGFVFLGAHFLGNTFSYVHQNKQICVSGRDTRMLFRNPPQFYGWY